MSLFARASSGLFASQSLLGHLLRGAAACALLYWAVVHQQAQPMGALLAGAGALIALRGCPMCWTLGLLETLQLKLKSRQEAGVAPTSGHNPRCADSIRS